MFKTEIYQLLPRSNIRSKWMFDKQKQRYAIIEDTILSLIKAGHSINNIKLETKRSDSLYWRIRLKARG